MSDPLLGGSDLFLVSNDKVIIELDNDSSQTGEFWILSDTNSVIFKVIEDGTVIVNGTTVHSSDRNRKQNIVDVNESNILKQIAQVPIYKWQYLEQEQEHIGRMAQDFYQAFGLGVDNTMIAAIDADGVALAAIKALYKENEALKKRITRLEMYLQENQE